MLREKFALSDQGVHDFKHGVAAAALANVVLFAPIAVLFVIAGGFVAHLVDPSQPLPNLAFYLPIIVVVLIAMFATQWLEYGRTYNVVYNESMRKRVDLAEKLRRLPLSFFGRRDLSDLTTAVMKDCSDHERMFSHVMPQLFGTAISTVIIAIALFVSDWRLALAALWPIPVAIVVLLATSRLQQRVSSARNEAELAMSDGIQEYLECAREIRATNQTPLFLGKVGERIDGFERAKIKAELAMAIPVSSAQALLKVGIGTTVLVGALLIAAGQVDFMMYFCFLLVVTRVYDPVSLILETTAELLDLRLNIKRLQAIEAEPAQAGATAFRPQSYDLSFENVSFSYEGGERVLDHVSFTAREGEVTALVGPSGGGKSTVAKLACRFWDAKAGTVRLGGVDVAGIDPETLLGDFAEVFQDVVLFDDTILGNIRLGRANATDDEVLAAARAAMCEDFVSRLPHGFHTRIGENGSRLSGGERQRISIARAILKNAPVVVLDEATASLDVENETQVQQALSRLLAGKTVLVIAHRMRTIANADKIVVLKEGRVAEQGAPAELMELPGGAYRRMVDLQTKTTGWSLAS